VRPRLPPALLWRAQGSRPRRSAGSGSSASEPNPSSAKPMLIGDHLIGWRRRFTGSFTWVRRLAFSQNLASSYDRDAEPPPAPGPGYLLPN
jgi:hypothetical protein